MGRKYRWLASGSAALGAVLSLSVCANAAVMNGLTADNSIGGTATGDGTSGTGAAVIDTGAANMFVGRYNGTTVTCAVLVFQLPTLAAGERIGSASLTYETLKDATATLQANIDLYGLGYRSASTVVAGDFYTGALDNTNATLLKDNLFSKWDSVSASSDLSQTTDAAVSAKLVDYLNAQYDAGAVGGNYVFIRFNYDDYTTGMTGRIVVATANNPTANYAPYITYTVQPVPEPASLTLVVSAGAMLLARKRW